MLYSLEIVKQIQVYLKFLLMHINFINFKSLKQINKVINLKHLFLYYI